MAKIKKIRRAQDGDDTKRCKIDEQGRKSCGPGPGQQKTSTRGTTYKTTKKEERLSQLQAKSREPYERDFPGDMAPGGFGGDSEGKKQTRWRTTEKKGTTYVGQSLGRPRVYQSEPQTRKEKRFEKSLEKKGVGLDMTTRVMPEKKRGKSGIKVAKKAVAKKAKVGAKVVKSKKK